MSDARLPTHVRREELTDAALHIVATKGIASLTTRRLAEHVGLSTGAIFRHFATLDALLEAVVARVESVLESTFPPVDVAPFERLERFIDSRSSAVGARLGILRLVLSEQFLLALPSNGSSRLARCIGRTRAFVERCLRDAQSTGQVRVDLGAEALAPIVMGTVQMLALSSARGSRRTAEARRVREALLTLLRAPRSGLPATRRRRRAR